MLIEFAEIYLMLSHYAGTAADGVPRRDRFNYILDQYEPTSGEKHIVLSLSNLLYSLILL